MRYVHLDTEFIPQNLTASGLISIGIRYMDDDGNRINYYAVNQAMDIKGTLTGTNGEWMRKHVWSKLPTIGKASLDESHDDVKSYDVIRSEVSDFFARACPSGSAKEDIEVVVDCGAQDMIRLHTLICANDWSGMPPWIPQGQDDMYRIKRRAYRLGMKKEDLPVQTEDTLHHALHDAAHQHEQHRYIIRRFGDI